MEISGDYYLTGVMETGCGIKLNDDNSFEFFYSYGALDRHGYGTWKKLNDNEIELNTDYHEMLPFTFISEEKKDYTGTRICIPNYNEILLRNTKIELFTNGNIEEQIADNNGVFTFSAFPADKIIVTCLFYFDNPAILKPADTSKNYFELAPNHNLPLVHFSHSKFRCQGETLTGKLHLLDDFKEYTFNK